MGAQPLRRWLALRIAWVAALPLAAVAALVWIWLVPQIRADLEVGQQALARAVSGQIETYLRGVRRQLDAVAGLRRNLGYRPPPYWFDPLDAHVGAGGVFEAIYLVDAADSVHSVGLPETQRDRRQDLIGLDLSRRDFLLQARERRETVWSTVFLSAVTGRLAVALAVPAVDQVIVGEIAIEPLAAFLNDLPGRSDLVALILDHRGQIIAHSQRALNGQQLNLNHLPVVRDALRDQFATRVFEFEGETLVGTVVGVPPVDWIVLIAQPRREVFRPVVTVLWVMATGMGVALLLAIVVGWALARDFSKRFALYIEQAAAIAGGDYDRPWPASHIVEFADLAKNLQRMSIAIRQREQALLASETRFRDLSTMASDWFWEQDDHFRFTFFSSGDATVGLERSGIVPARLLGKTRWEMPIDLTAAQWIAHRALLEAHQPFRDFEYRLRLDGGGERWSSVNGQPLFDSAGRFAGYRGTGRDITERKRSEARQRLAAAVFEAARDAILVTDAEGRIIAVNPAFTTLTGYGETEVRGRSPRMLWAERQPEDYFEAMWEIVVSEGVWQGEFWARRKDGERRAALANLAAVRDADGRITHYVGIATDITALKAAERRIEHQAYY
ncbi:MAG: PAS domain S-box protein, partial [Candidatus Competibacter sp.]|nr:PAS domain S-box protein [Candidatus Competibacter sp.]